MQTASQIIAHRGASAYAPENTFSAFERALSMGSQWIEFDVMLSKDGEAFVFHDETLKRTTNGKGQINHVTADYLRTLDAGSWFSKTYQHEKIPSLQELLVWLSQNSIHANMEIKPILGFAHEITLTTLQLIYRYWPDYKDRLLISSFDIAVLRFCRSLEPELPLGLLIKKWSDDSIVCAQELNCTTVSLERSITTADRVKNLKNNGFKVCVYTVNRKREALRFFNWGVDFVFSDYPDLLEKNLKQRLFKKFVDKKSCVA